MEQGFDFSLVPKLIGTLFSRTLSTSGRSLLLLEILSSGENASLLFQPDHSANQPADCQAVSLLEGGDSSPLSVPNWFDRPIWIQYCKTSVCGPVSFLNRTDRSSLSLHPRPIDRHKTQNRLNPGLPFIFRNRLFTHIRTLIKWEIK